MFNQLAGSQSFRSPATVPGAEYVTILPFDTRIGSQYLVFTTTGRSAGTVTPKLQGSWDGGTTYLDMQSAAAIGANGISYLAVPGPWPPLTRLLLTPAGGFDGSLGIRLRSSGAVQ